MACSGNLVEVPRKERRVEAGKAVDEIDMEKMRGALILVVEALEAKIKGSGGSRVKTGKEEILTEMSVEALLVALGALVETMKMMGAVAVKPQMSVDAVAVASNQTEMETVAIENQTEIETGKDKKNKTDKSFIDRFLDEFEFVDLFEDTVDDDLDEDLIKDIAELQEMWRYDYPDEAFGDPCHPYCLVACD